MKAVEFQWYNFCQEHSECVHNKKTVNISVNYVVILQVAIVL